MARALFYIFTMLSFFSMGTALFAGGLHLRMLSVGRGKEHLWYAMAKAGYVVTQSILLLAIFPVQQVEPEWRAYGYLVGMLLAGVGFMGVGRDAINQWVEEDPQAPYRKLEARMTAEEERSDRSEARSRDHGESRQSEHDKPDDDDDYFP